LLFQSTRPHAGRALWVPGRKLISVPAPHLVLMRFLFWQDGCLYESDGEKTERISMPMYPCGSNGLGGVIVEEEMTREQCRAKFPAPPLDVDLCARHQLTAFARRGN
jgi:hypothetical protein